MEWWRPKYVLAVVASFILGMFADYCVTTMYLQPQRDTMAIVAQNLVNMNQTINTVNQNVVAIGQVLQAQQEAQQGQSEE